VHIVYTDPQRVVRARFVLREHAIRSSLTPGVPISDDADAPLVSVIEVADSDAERVTDLLSQFNLMGSVGDTT
jgi:hypothetical protein